MSIDELIAEVEFLAGTDDPKNLAARLGYQRPDSLCRRLERNGRPDLARYFDLNERTAA